VRLWQWFAAAGIWLLAVAAVAGVALVAIDSAGHEVGVDAAIGLVAAPASPSAPRTGASTGGTGTFSSAGGDVVVRCVTGVVRGWMVRPGDGWRVEAALGGHGDLVARFTPVHGPAVQIHVACWGSGPALVPSRSPSGR
jgi:hypothetical protein